MDPDRPPHEGAPHPGTPARPARRREWWLLAGVVLTAVVHTVLTLRHTPGADVGWAESALYCGVFLGAAALCLTRSVRHPGERWGWFGLGAGLGVYSAGNAYYYLVVVNDPSPAYPSPADWLWLAFFPCAYAGLLMLVRAGRRRFPPIMWLDGVVAALGVGAVGYALGFDRLLVLSGGALPVVLTNLAYPLGDFLLLVIVVWAAGTAAGLADRMWTLLAAGLVCLTVADAVYAVQTSAGTYADGGPLDALWPLAGVLVAAATVCPQPARAGTGQRPASWWAVVLFPGCFVVASVALLVYDQAGGPVPAVSAVLALAAILATSVRAAITSWQVSRLAESQRLAHTDELTGLRNRRGFGAGLRAVLDGRAASEAVAVMLIDLDRFKEVNDALGHAVGDDLLTLVGPRMQRCLRQGDLLARLGGDEFAVVLSPDGGARAAAVVAERITQAMKAAFELPEMSLHVGASIGIAVCPDHATDAAGLLRQADVAMYDAKHNGGGYRLYDPARDAHSRDRLRTIEQLRAAIIGHELVLHYQPKVDLPSGNVLGVEALARWQHPERGLLLPEHFLALAEQTGLMRPFTDHVLDEALSQLRAWLDQGWSFGMAVNISASNLLDTGLPQQVAAKLSRHGVPAHLLHLEITESTIMADPARARQVVQRLHEHGVRVSVDDYGTGHSSLAYLRHLAVRELKLDRAFVQDVCRDPRASAIVRSTVDLAHSLGLDMVAEGVEDEDSARKLATFGCTIAQGYHYSRPLSAAALGEWLADHHAHTRRDVTAAG